MTVGILSEFGMTPGEYWGCTDYPSVSELEQRVVAQHNQAQIRKTEQRAAQQVLAEAQNRRRG